MVTLEKMNVATKTTIADLERKWGRGRLYLAGIIIVAILLLLVWRAIATRQKPTPPPPPRAVLVSPVTQKDVPVYLEEIGNCAAYETVQVQAQVAGQILERHFQDGADVKKGDLLFTIDPRPYQAALEQAQAQATLDKITMKRQEELRARSVISPQDFDQAQANMHKSEAAVAAAQVNLDYCYIKSPINGRIGLRNVDTGNLVGPSSPPLVVIQGLDPIYTDFTVAETDLGFVKKYLGGPNVKVQTWVPDQNMEPRTGTLYFIDTAVQPGAGTVKARAVTPNPDRALWPMEFVRVRFILDMVKDAKLVPSQAVQISQRGPFVFVVKADKTVELRPVKPGQRQDGEMTVIESGVNVGESVVVTGQLSLGPGTKVNPQPYQPNNPADGGEGGDGGSGATP